MLRAALAGVLAAWALAGVTAVGATAAAGGAANPFAVPSNPSAVPSNPSAVPSNPSAVLSNPSAVPSNPSAVPSNPSAVPSNPSAVPHGFVGMNVDGPVYPPAAPGIDLPQQFATMEAAGVESVRVVFDWAQAQPYARWSDVPAADVSVYANAGGVPTDFSQMDEIVSLAAQRGMTVLPTVIYAPRWDLTGASSHSFGRPARDAPFARFLTDLVDRYGPEGSFWSYRSGPIEPIREWQIWNEPNFRAFWPAQPFAATYVDLLAAAHQAIKRADPDAKVVLAGLPNDVWAELETIYKVRGAGSDFDVVGVHPYTATPAGVITILEYVRDVMDANGDSAKPIIADELGWPSSQGRASAGAPLDLITTEAGQAIKTAAVLPLLARYRTSLDIAGFDYYTWASQAASDGYAFTYAGLFKYSRGALRAKPAFIAFTRAALRIEHCGRKGAVANVCSDPTAP